MPRMEEMVWDPHNLIKGEKLAKGHIEKRLAERRARQRADGPRNMVLKLPDDVARPVSLKDAQDQFRFNGKPFVEHMKVRHTVMLLTVSCAGTLLSGSDSTTTPVCFVPVPSLEHRQLFL
jgi:hypothetical protein